MSGIAGILLFDASLDGFALVRQITAAMRHRGPDDTGHWSSGRVTLGHCMLRTTPEAAGERQPVVDRERKLVLVWDGRLDNRDELYDRLQPRFPRQGEPDSAYVLEAYRKWGEDCPSHLLGDFAFALWDMDRQRLFCARDPMGGAPLAYVLNARFCAFASESEALLGLPGVSGEPNEDCIANFLVPGFFNRDDHRTWQRDVLAVLAGESMSIERDGRTRIRCYRELRPAGAQNHASHAECAEYFLQVFGEAVRCRMRSAGGLALMLSGGLDSAGVLAMTRRQLPAMHRERFSSYSAVDDQPESSLETQAIRSMAGLAGVDAHFVAVPSFQGMVSAADLVETAWSRAHPVDNWILLPALMCLAASRDSQRVMLHGACGDVTLQTPLRYVSNYLRRGQFLQAWQECRAASENHVYLRGIPPLANFTRSAYAAFMPVALKLPINRLRRHWRQPVLEASIINLQFADKIQLLQRMEQQLRTADTASADTVDAMHIGAVRQKIMSALSASQRVASRQGIELRDPWGDRRVVELFLGLPLRFKVRDGWTKYLVRTAFQRDLEPGILWRRDKEHLGWKVNVRLLQESRELIDRLIREEIDVIEDFVDVAAVRAMHACYRKTAEPAAGDSLFGLIALILWLKRVKSC